MIEMAEGAGAGGTVELPSLMGLPLERHIAGGEGHGPFYTCVLNGWRFCVYHSMPGADEWHIDRWKEVTYYTYDLCELFVNLGSSAVVGRCQIGEELTLIGVLHHLSTEP